MIKPKKLESKFLVNSSSSSRRITHLNRREELIYPSVLYSPKAYHKILHVVAACPKEVGWFGTVDIVGNIYTITDIFVPEQIVTNTETEIKPEALSDIALSIQDPEKLIYWGHSHINMACSPSKQDEEQTEEYLDHTDVFIRGIYNKKGDSKVDVFDTQAKVIYECVKDSPIIVGMDEEELKIFTEGIKETVKERQYTPPSFPKSYNYNGGNSHKNNTRSKVNPFLLESYMGGRNG